LVNERRQMGYGSYSSGNLKVLGEQVDQPIETAEPTTAESPEPSSTDATKSKWQSTQSPSNRSNLLSSATPSPAGIFSSTLSAHNDPKSAVGKSLHPLLCVSTHQHCYLGDYGVWGREEYVKNWWTKVDWKKVEDSFDAFTSKAGKR